jgi:protein gp37
MTGSKIEWTDRTWNPVTGCTKVSPGCDHCYAEGIARRFAGSKAFPNGFDVTLQPERLDAPLRWRKPARVFVNSMSDLFHDDVPDDFIARVFAVMAAGRQHTFQLLTKRHGRMRSLLGQDAFRARVRTELAELRGLMLADVALNWPLPNVWLGVSVEDQKRADLRIPALLDTPAAVRFLSCEPLLGPVDLQHVGPDQLAVCDPTDIGYESGGPGGWMPGETIDWVIVGGESGSASRPMHPQWARQIRDECRRTQTAFHFKQWGESAPLDQLPDATQEDWEFRNGTGFPAATMCRVGKKAAGRVLDGRTWDEFPAVLA